MREKPFEYLDLLELNSSHRFGVYPHFLAAKIE